VQAIRLDNAGENKSLKQRCDSKDWQLGIKFEFTARDTPQQNSLAEVGFATIANRGRAMMHQANLPASVRPRVWTEAFKTATLLDGLVPIEINGKLATKYVHWCGENPMFAKHLRTWGEAGTVKIKTDTTPKLADQGVQCMFVGYAMDHPGDCYRMWNPATKRVHETRDVIWMRRMYYAAPVKEADVAIGPIELEIEIPPTVNVNNIQVGEGYNAHDDDAIVANENANDDDDDDDDADDDGQATTASAVTTRAGRISRAPQRLIAEMNATAARYEVELTNAEEHYYVAMREFPDGEFSPGELAFVGAGLGGGFENTQELHVMKYDEAMASEDRDKWRESVNEEHDRMKSHGLPSGTD
jgi:hypothetical protein